MILTRANKMYLCSYVSLQVRSTTETLLTGTLKAIPVNFPFRAGMTLPTAFAAPVVAGIILSNEHLPRKDIKEMEDTLLS